MTRKQFVFFCKCQAFVTKVKCRQHRWRSLFFVAVLFFVTMMLTPVVATVSNSPLLTQTQQNGLQLAAQGKLLYQAGSFAAAVEAWRRAANAFASVGDRINQAMALSNLSLTYQQLGQWQAAKEAITTSLSLLKTQTATSTQKRIFAQTLEIRGKLELATGQSTAALETWQQATALYSQISDRAGIIQSQVNSAQALQTLGLYPRAKATLLDVKQKLHRQPNSPVKVTGLLSLGNALNVLGDLKKAEEALQESLRIAKTLQPSPDRGAIFLSLGNVARAQNQKNIQLALDYYKQAESSASPTVKIQAQLNQLKLLVENKQWQDAQIRWLPILKQLNKLPPSRSTVYAQLNLAQSLMCLQPDLEKSELNSPVVQECTNYSLEQNQITLRNSIKAGTSNWTEIEKLLTTAIQQANGLQDQRAEAYALGYRGALYQQAQQWAAADTFTRKAVSLAMATSSPDVAYLWQWQLGRIARANGDSPSAIAAYTVAFKTLQSLRGDLVATNPEIQYSFRDSVEPVYRELADLLLQKGAKGTVSQENVKQAREVIEALQLAELDDFFREACVTAKPEQIDRVVDKANSPSAVFYAIFLHNRLEVILKLPGQEELRHYTTSVNQAQAEEILQKLQDALPQVEQVNEVKNLSYRVYQWLIQPAREQLKGIKSLVFVLDGRLRNIPMAVLYDGKQYLIEQYAIALTPGLQLLSPKPLAQVSLNTLAAGVSEEREIENRQFNSLENVKAELREIQEEVPVNKELLNQAFTRINFQKQIDATNFSVVHMATHGQFSSNPEETFIVLWDKLLKVRDFDTLLRSGDRTRNQPVELLVLSACETAVGDHRATLGLAGVAVRAGARSTVATLWPVDDPLTAFFMSQFYEALKNPNFTKAQALQAAQNSLRAKDSRPYFWAPYVLVGNWL
ncbi:MAG: CHAT domain-containing protein [Chlorogloeopsis fritschii C42_A2020_084]|uniref:CHAT domain-containing protein n=1 Tax=Chlorogloeopsis fritschii TaxID=1124 RepID=UPI0019EA5C9C|nr:CHAT domain-containing protein [Chlorogloeopsis fritschii]MBF2005546.1 CHAT domain-containing protein [Chlorogloeopsis fritschii C42_A2020_084]